MKKIYELSNFSIKSTRNRKNSSLIDRRSEQIFKEKSFDSTSSFYSFSHCFLLSYLFALTESALPLLTFIKERMKFLRFQTNETQSLNNLTLTIEISQKILLKLVLFVILFPRCRHPTVLSIRLHLGQCTNRNHVLIKSKF